MIDWNYFTGGIPSSNVAENLDTLISAGMYFDPPAPGATEQPAGVPLPEITLRRGSRIGLPTGQEACRMAEIPCLAAEQIGFDDAERQFLGDHGFLERTPLWYYILREAEVEGLLSPAPFAGRAAECLGPLGSRIVAEVLLGVMHADSDHYLNHNPGWLPPKVTIGSSHMQTPLNHLKTLAVYVANHHASAL